MKLFKNLIKKRLMKNSLDYSIENNWYQTGKKYDENKIDVFYILSTRLVKAVDENGNQVFRSTLSAEDRKMMQEEYDYMSTELFDSDDFNFFAPYYRQLTGESYMMKDKKAFTSEMVKSAADVYASFDYYMKHQNNGRPFILAGFSQGGLMSQVLLKSMTDEQYSKLIAAYSMGFQIKEKEAQHPHINPATGEDDLGVTISYNSVASTDTMWNQIEGHAVACINPLNWKTDDTPAELLIDGDRATVHVDQEHQVLVVEGLDPDKYDGRGYPLKKGVYHMWDPIFYAAEIRQNALHRAKLFSNK